MPICLWVRDVPEPAAQKAADPQAPILIIKKIPRTATQYGGFFANQLIADRHPVFDQLRHAVLVDEHMPRGHGRERSERPERLLDAAEHSPGIGPLWASNSISWVCKR